MWRRQIKMRAPEPFDPAPGYAPNGLSEFSRVVRHGNAPAVVPRRRGRPLAQLIADNERQLAELKFNITLTAFRAKQEKIRRNIDAKQNFLSRLYAERDLVSGTRARAT
jgi:hypothetical protein